MTQLRLPPLRPPSDPRALSACRKSISMRLGPSASYWWALSRLRSVWPDLTEPRPGAELEGALPGTKTPSASRARRRLQSANVQPSKLSSGMAGGRSVNRLALAECMTESDPQRRTGCASSVRRIIAREGASGPGCGGAVRTEIASVRKTGRTISPAAAHRFEYRAAAGAARDDEAAATPERQCRSRSTRASHDAEGADQSQTDGAEQ